MPIPQCSVDPLDRYRSDFVLIVKSKKTSEWEWLSVEIDSTRYHQNIDADKQKDDEVQQNGFKTVRIRTEGKDSILNGVRNLFGTLEKL